MSPIAGVAFGGPGWFSTFSICCGDTEPPTLDVLRFEAFSNEDSEDVMSAVKACQQVLKDKGRFNPALESVTLTFQIALPYKHGSRLVSKARPRYHVTDYMYAYIHLHFGGKPYERMKENVFLFLDLTPGQIIGKLSTYYPDTGTVWKVGVSGWNGAKELAVEELFELIVSPLLTLVRQEGSPVTLAGVGILWPEEAHPEMSRSAVEARFPDTAVRFVSLADLAEGAALSMLVRTSAFS